MSEGKAKQSSNILNTVIAGVLIATILGGFSAYVSILNKETYLSAMQQSQDQRIDKFETQIDNRINRIEDKIDLLLKAQGYKIPIPQ